MCVYVGIYPQTKCDNDMRGLVNKKKKKKKCTSPLGTPLMFAFLSECILTHNRKMNASQCKKIKFSKVQYRNSFKQIFKTTYRRIYLKFRF